ncbi:hypothetical protein OB13_10830 [Pontibacter sp. HJ8]
MIPEEQLLDELLDETKAGSINQTIKVYPDANRIDETKTSGRQHRTLLATIITRLKAWVVALLDGKSDTGHGHTIDEVDNLQTTLNSHNQRITANTDALPLKADLIGGKVPPEQLPEIGPAIVLDEQPTAGSQNSAKSGGIFSWVNTQISAALGNGGSMKAAGATSGTLTVNFDNNTDEYHLGDITGAVTIAHTGTRLGNAKIVSFRHNGSSTVTISNGIAEDEVGFIPAVGQSHKVHLRLGVGPAGTTRLYYHIKPVSE